MRRHWISVAYLLQKFPLPKHMDALLVSFAFIQEKHMIMDGWSERSRWWCLDELWLALGRRDSCLLNPHKTRPEKCSRVM